MTKFSTAFSSIHPIPQSIWYLSGLFLILNGLQAYSTPIMEDEAYYFLYAQHLDWGYYDHPPMVALLIALGTFLADGLLGIRIGAAVLSAINILLIWQIVNNIKPIAAKHFLWIYPAFVYVQIYGFVTTPDVPFIFFSLCFLWQYQRYLSSNKLLDALLWGTLMALLMYSKYLGVLLIGFTLLSNWRLLQRGSFWLATVWSLILFFPHLYWQWQQEFPSLFYHLYYRSIHTFRWDFFLNSLLNIPLVIALIGLPFYGQLFRAKTDDLFIKALQYNACLTPLFFLFFSGTNIVQPQWLITMIIPVLIYTLVQVGQQELLPKWIRMVVLGSIGFALIIRLLIASVDLFSKRFFLNIRDMETWTYQLDSIADNRPVLFINGFQKPSLYHFYTQKPVIGHNNIGYRQTQYDLWDFDAQYYKQAVFAVADASFYKSKALTLDAHTTLYGLEIEEFMPFQKIKINTTNIEREGEQLKVTIEVQNPYSFDYAHNPQQHISFHLMAKNAEDIICYQQELSDFPQDIAAKTTKKYYLTIKLPKDVEDESWSKIGITLTSPIFGIGFNGNFKNIN